MSDTASWTERVRKSWVMFWLEKLALLATVVGIWFGVSSLRAIEEEREVREEEREARKEERKIWYWTLLTTPAPGNSGKIEALQYLAKQGVPLPSIDLSCRAMRGEEPDTDSDDPKATKCERPVYLKKLDLSKKMIGKKANLIGADLSDANLRSANLSGVDLRRADLRRAKLRRANLSGAKLGRADLIDADLRRAKLIYADLRYADLSDADLYSANLSDANLRRVKLSDADLRYADLSDANLSDANLSDADLSDADLSDANLSDADFKNATFSSDTTFTNAWAWADEPPRNLSATIQIQLCKYNTEGSSGDLGDLGDLRTLRNLRTLRHRHRHRRPNSCIPPDTTK